MLEIGGVDLKPPSDGAYLNEADLPKIRGTFWHHNIVGFAPMLPVSVSMGDDTDAKNLTLLGTYFPSVSLSARKISPLVFASRIPGGKCKARGPTIIPLTYCSAKVWR